jgi:hypothetical protein
MGRNRETPALDRVGMVVRWPSLPSPIVHATLALAGSPAHLVARWIAHNVRASVRRLRRALEAGRAVELTPIILDRPQLQFCTATRI